MLTLLALYSDYSGGVSGGDSALLLKHFGKAKALGDKGRGVCGARAEGRGGRSG